MDRLSDSTLIKLQAGSGLAFGSFLTLHLANALFAHKGAWMYDAVMHYLRGFYQNPLVEPTVIVAALVVHSASGLERARRRSKQPQTKVQLPLELQLHRAAGYAIGAVIVGHILATRGIGLIFSHPACHAFIHSTLKWFPYIFYPYYIAFSVSGFYHLFYGITQSCSVFFHRTPIKRGGFMFWSLIGLGAVSLVSAVLAFGGCYFPITIPPRELEFLQYTYSKYLPSFMLPWKSA